MEFHKVKFMFHFFPPLFYIHYLPKILTKNAKLVLRADDTSITATYPSHKDFKLT